MQEVLFPQSIIENYYLKGNQLPQSNLGVTFTTASGLLHHVKNGGAVDEVAGNWSLAATSIDCVFSRMQNYHHKHGVAVQVGPERIEELLVITIMNASNLIMAIGIGLGYSKKDDLIRHGQLYVWQTLAKNRTGLDKVGGVLQAYPPTKKSKLIRQHRSQIIKNHQAGHEYQRTAFERKLANDVVIGMTESGMPDGLATQIINNLLRGRPLF